MAQPAYVIYQRAQVPSFSGDAEGDASALRDWINLELGNIQPAIPVRTTKTVTANYTLTVNDDMVDVDCTAGALTITFPDPTNAQYGTWTIKKVDSTANAVTISGVIRATSVAATFDGSTAPTLVSRYDTKTFRSNGLTYDGVSTTTPAIFTGSVPAANVTSGTFGSASGDTNPYKFPEGAIFGQDHKPTTLTGIESNKNTSVWYGDQNATLSSSWKQVNAQGQSAISLLRYDGTISSPTAVLSAETMGVLAFGGYDGGVGLAFANGVRILAATTQNWSSTAHGSQLQLATVPNGSTTLTTALTLDQDQSATFAGAVKVPNATFISYAATDTLYADTTISIWKNPTALSLRIVNTEILGLSAGAASFGSNAVSMGALTATTGTFSGNVAINVSAASAQLALNPTAGGGSDSAQLLVKRNGTLKWQVGNNVSLGSDFFEIYATVGGVSAVQINPTTGAVNTGADFAVNGSKFTVASASGNTVAAGTFQATAATLTNSGIALTIGANANTTTEIRLNAAAGQGVYTRFDTAGTAIWGVGRGVSAGAATFEFYNFTLAASALSLADVTGAATFASDVSGQSFFPTGGGSARGLYKDAINGLQLFGITGATSDFAIWQTGGGAAALSMPTGTSNINLGGKLSVALATTFNKEARLQNTTVAGLTAAATAGAGATAFVTDSTLGIGAGLGLAVVGGGANGVPVFSDGATWRVG